MERGQRLIVVGGNAAGMAAALRARRHRPNLDITIVERTDRITIANCAIPSYLDGQIESIDTLQQLSINEARTRHHLNVLTGHRALEIQPIKHLLTVENLATGQVFDLPYGRLILSTGADPIRPDWPNSRSRGIFTLRNLSDAWALRQFLENKKPTNIVIIGTGTIAQVCASALRSYGAEVLMVGLTNGLMDDLEAPISDRILDALTKGNINTYFTDNLYGFNVSLEDEVTNLDAAVKSFPCQAVLLAMGVRPNADLAKSTNIASSIANAIRIDRHLMTSRQGIYACGDCTVTFNRITHKPVYWPLATTAVRQGRQAGESASGGHGYDHGTLLSRLWTCFDLQIGRVGLSSGQAKEAGFRPKLTEIKAPSKSIELGGDQLDLILISDSKDGRIIGAQIAGTEGVHARLNTLAVAIAGKLTVSDLEHLDLGYTPRIASLWDPVQIAGRLGGKRP